MLDVKVLRLAGRQRSLVTRRQLVELGCSKTLIEAWLDAGLVFRVHRGVYALAGARVDFDFKVLAGVLAAGEGAVASHRTAAALFGLRRVFCNAVEITVPGRRAPKGKGLVGHRSDRLEAGDQTLIGIVPVTAPARTVLDLAAVLDRSQLGGVLDDVLVRKLASLGAVERLLTRTGGERRAGAGVLAELVAERRSGQRPSESGLEDELLQIFNAYGLPEPVRQFVLPLPGGGSVRFDAAYPELLLGFEADGDRWHKGRLDRIRDEARDGQCGLIGWTVRRYDTEDIRERPAGVADEVWRLYRLAAA
ncbi:MAG TPA: type IV toxin-antitoxin system AbiEi family antitoxin domain-containing protein [Acidimicrobiia bacterium]|nr:type IV toxin-antitoxin system AbiEi family antitoxin domain-containing protein [Acidimicrobiales bacterium]HVW34948.1 type IV toxin-antitoxin system AbiEi family antitoxin domain-containing protein [Acidimicrobiia bacterium]